MENASRALIMAASVLLGVMIITVATVLFNSFAGSGRKIIESIEEKQVTEFNADFYKYYGKIDGDYIPVTAHDIVTVAYLAKENNKKLGVESEKKCSQKSNYIQVQVDKITNFELESDSTYAKFIKDNTLTNDANNIKSENKYYVCKQIIVNETNGKVIYIKFEEKK